MRFPENLRYGPEHEWSEVAPGHVVTVGITDYAQDQLGDVQWVELPRVGAEVELGAAFVEVESTKTASEVYAPCSGRVVEVNESLVGDPEQVNTDPYAAWFVRIQASRPEELDRLRSAEEYAAELA
ncbi:glycine cleavage system protein GcvH [Umezawaea sp. NPDC059074]|uniref:glycine cleavage system protein GcvH n=1 Tax=Umezawaea sp. NPDC059074 TaxID=3346716 RepID=UPI003697C6AD